LQNLEGSVRRTLFTGTAPGTRCFRRRPNALCAAQPASVAEQA